MKIERIITDNLDENCYLLTIGNKCLLIDPGSSFELIKSKIGDKKLLKVLITHKHFDHIGALRDIMDLYKVDYMDYETLKEQEYSIEDFKFSVIFNPGHSYDSVSYYFKDVNSIFVGDFIFKDSIGRCDLDTGNFELMNVSIEKIKKYPEDMIIYPGHGDQTTLGREILYNRFF